MPRLPIKSERYNLSRLEHSYKLHNLNCLDADAKYWRLKYDEEYAKLKTDLALAKSDAKHAIKTAELERETAKNLRQTDLILGDISNDARRRKLIDRYADLFTGERLYAMKALRQKTQDEDVIKRIIYTAVVESFRSSQRSFREFRTRARRAVALGSVLPTTGSVNKNLHE